MLINYAKSGEINFTVNGDDAPPGIEGNWLKVPASDLGDLTAWRVIKGALVLVDLGPARARAVDEINQTIGALRANVITTLPGQEMIYLAKETEARSFLALDLDGADPRDFPLLAAEIGITAKTAWELAQIWANMAVAWRTTAAGLESARLGTIALIEHSDSLKAVDAALAAFHTQLERI